MRYTFCPADPVWYATNLRLDAARGMLQWTGGRGQDALLVRTPYGVDPEAFPDALCAALEQTELREGRFTELIPGAGTGRTAPSGTGMASGAASSSAGALPPGTAARIVSALERAKRNGCPIDGEARTYTVFACRTVLRAGPGGGLDVGPNAGQGSGERFLYGHQRGEISSPHCDVALRLRADVEAVKPRGLLDRLVQNRLAGNGSGYYRISFPSRCPEGFRDGDLEYWIDDFAVPVTRRMLEAGSVYVRTDLRPRIVSRAAGLTLEGG